MVIKPVKKDCEVKRFFIMTMAAIAAIATNAPTASGGEHESQR
jgi:hypothetical protein